MSRAVSKALGVWLFAALALTLAIAPGGPARSAEDATTIDEATTTDETTTIDEATTTDETTTTDEATTIDEATTTDEATTSEDAATGDDEGTSIIDAGHAYASAGVRGLGAWIDGFFADERYEAELNESRLRVRIDSFSEMYEGTEVDGKIRLYLKLPAFDERVRVEVLSAGEAQEDTTIDGRPAEAPPSDFSVDSITAALAYFFRNDEDRSISARIGLDFDGYDPNPFFGLRYREQVEFADDWNFRFVQRFRYYSLDGLESRTVLGLDYALPSKVLLRWEIDGNWLEEQPEYFYGLNFSVFQPLDTKSAVEYQVSNLYRTQPHRLDQVTLALRYRRQAWREWLIVEAAPQLAMPRTRNYEPVPGFLFRIEMSFGG